MNFTAKTGLVLCSISAMMMFNIGGLNQAQAAGSIGVAIPNTFTPGTTISSASMNSNFASVAAQMPAIKALTVSGAFTVNSVSPINLGSLTINTPTTGYVMLRFDGVSNVGNLGDYLYIAASDTSGQISSTAGLMGYPEIYIDAPATGSNVYLPFSHTVVVPVTSSGSHTYYAVASGSADTDRIWGTLTVEFFPNGL